MTFVAGAPNYIVLEKYSGGARSIGTSISLTSNTNYYVTLKRNSTTLYLYVYSDYARTTQITGSPQTLSVVSTGYANFGLFNDIAYTGLRSYNITNLTFTNTTTPVITNPTSNSVASSVESVDFNWTVSTNASTYFYQVANDSAFTDLMWNAETVNNYSGALSIPVDKTLYFRVLANDSVDNSSWSDVVSIRYNLIVGNWTFNEGTGTWANDTSGFNNNGTITGATWNNTDVINNKSLYFDGNDFINITASTSINISAAQSFTGWIKTQNVSHTRRIIEKGGTNWEYGILTDDNNLIYTIWNPDGSNHAIVTATNVIQNDTWQFISGTYENGVLQTLRVNNVLVASTTTFSGVTSPGTDPLVFGRRTTTPDNNFTGLMDEFKLYNYALNESELTAEYQRFHPVLTYPINGSTVLSIYPPQTATINFTWYDTEYPANELIVARDINFNIVDVDVFTSNDYYSATLSNNQTYYWKIKQYNTSTGTYGDTSPTHNFTITSSVSSSGHTGIYGVVYEIVNGLQVPVSGATVYISNSTSTWSSFQVVGSNGYYLFDNLAANTTYWISAKATGYDNSVTEYVTTVNNVWTQKDIKLTVCISGQDCFGVKNYVKFVATDFFGTLYPSLSVNVYKGSEVTTIYESTTGTDGAATFLLTKDQSYRLVFSGSTITTTTITITPGESTLFYVFVSTSTPLPFWDNSSWQEVDTVTTSVISSTVGNVGYINVTYNDTLGQTTAWTVYINQSNHTQPNASQTTIQSMSGSGNFTANFNLTSNFQGESYLVNIQATHTTFGQIRRSYGVQFYGTKDGSLDFIPSVIMALIAILILIFAGSFFDSTNFAQGAGLICVIGWIELGLGMFAYANLYIPVGVGLGLGSVIAIIANMNERNKRETVG